MREYGLQMYSLRDITEGDLAGALRKVSEMGYRFVEFAGFFGHSAEEIADMLRENGLAVSGTHTGASELADDCIEETIAFHKAIGNPNLIIPGIDLSTPEKLDAFVKLVNNAQPKLAAAGIRLGFHNHSGEFRVNDFGVITHHELERRTNLEFEIDTYWAFVAGEDPIALLSRLGDRVKVIHLKDGSAGGKGCSLGAGEAPVKAVHDYAVRHGICIVVESEGCEPTGLEEVGRCFDYLKCLNDR